MESCNVNRDASCRRDAGDISSGAELACKAPCRHSAHNPPQHPEEHHERRLPPFAGLPWSCRGGAHVTVFCNNKGLFIRVPSTVTPEELHQKMANRFC